MTPRDLRTATWVQLDHPLALDNGFRIWTAREAPGIARLAHNGKLYFRFQQRDYSSVDSVVRAYNAYEKAQKSGPLAAPGTVAALRQRQAGRL